MTQASAFRPAASPAPNRQQRRQAKQQSRKARAKGLPSIAGPAQALFEQSAQKHQAGQLDEAVALLQQAEALAPGNPMTAARLGAVLAQQGKHGEAVSLLEKACAALPAYAPAQINLGIALQALERGEEAAEYYAKALLLDPKNPQIQGPFTGWTFTRQRFAESLPVVEQALKKAPGETALLNVLGVCCLRSGRPEDAVAALRKAVAQKPEDPELNSNLGVSLFSLGRREEAAEPLLKGFPMKREMPAYQYMLSESMGHLRLQPYRPELDEVFLACFEGGHASVRTMAAPLGVHLWIKYMESMRVETRAGAPRQAHLDGILADPLLIALLEKGVAIHLGLESLLVPIRRTLLLTARKQASLSEGAMRFVAATAMQCHNNAYIFSAQANEEAEIEALGAELDAALAALPSEGAAPGNELDIRLALYAMYRRLPSLAHFQRLLAVPLESWSEILRPLIELVIQAPAEEQRLRDEIPAFGPIEDAVSQAVRSQYEENPYPRWTSLPIMQPGDLQGYLADSLPWQAFPPDPEGGVDILIAGCGTGQHPLAVAERMPQSRMIAVDLSLSSLAYAKRMSAKYDLTNISFHHGDLRNVAAFGKQFHLVECAGVLHHMADPEEGFASLVEVTRPGGIMRIGLYSELARDFVNRARARIAELDLKPVAADIRAYRQRVIAKQEPDLDRFAATNDFFDLDSLRDLIFHVQEQQFTIPRIRSMLADQGLAFLGFNGLKPTAYTAFGAAYPDRASLSDLDAWQAFEEANPATFIGMYQFTCRKPA